MWAALPHKLIETGADDKIGPRWPMFALRPSPFILSIPFSGVAVIAAGAYYCAAKQSTGYVWQWLTCC